MLSLSPPTRGRRAMPKEIFDQERPRSAMARRLDEAFAGCEQWTLAPPAPKRSETASTPRLYDAAGMLGGGAASMQAQEPGTLY